MERGRRQVGGAWEVLHGQRWDWRIGVNGGVWIHFPKVKSKNLKMEDCWQEKQGSSAEKSENR